MRADSDEPRHFGWRGSNSCRTIGLSQSSDVILRHRRVRQRGLNSLNRLGNLLITRKLHTAALLVTHGSAFSRAGSICPGSSPRPPSRGGPGRRRWDTHPLVKAGFLDLLVSSRSHGSVLLERALLRCSPRSTRTHHEPALDGLILGSGLWPMPVFPELERRDRSGDGSCRDRAPASARLAVVVALATGSCLHRGKATAVAPRSGTTWRALFSRLCAAPM